MDDAGAEHLVVATATGSIPHARRRVLDHLLASPGERPLTRVVADAIHLPTPLVHRSLEDVAALGLVTRSAEKDRGHHHWSLSDDARALARRARLVGEGSVE